MAYRQNNQSLTRSLILWTFVIFASLTAANALYVVTLAGVWSDQSSQRQLASDSHPPAQTVPLKVKDEPITIDCQFKQRIKPRKTLYANTRIVLKNCERARSIINLANNSYADLFFISKNNWTTDFIVLNHGLNSIEIEWGANKQTIEINREKPTAPEGSKDL